MDDGMMAITVSIDTKKNEMISKPEIYAKGLIDQGNQKRHDELVDLLDEKIKEKLQTRTLFAELKLLIKEVAGLYIYSKTKRHPIIIPVIMSKN